jgi:L-cysteine:1D-myo-inositol 2-amino-2-deoxy-alpha-D-glucopyranoside ligase
MGTMPAAPRSSLGVVGLARRADAAASPRTDAVRLRLGGRSVPMLGTVRSYVCGITPYDVTHVGHAATFVWADTLRAVATLAGARVETCRNVTDVDDVLTHAAWRHDREYDEFALGQEFLFGRDMAALRVRQPTHEPRARHHVDDVVRLTAALLERGAAYARGGHVWFRGGDVPAAAGLDADEATRRAVQGGDDPTDERKDDPFDVPLWRPSDEHHPAWPSPWGWGRPGWHVECAAMATAVLGSSVDVLAGGADLAFPHHAYQVAMAERATGVTPFARVHLPVGTVHVDGHKMAKSTGNLVLVTDLLQMHRPAAVRMLLLNRRWDQGWELRTADLDDAAARVDALYEASGHSAPDRGAEQRVRDALLDDLDVPTAIDSALTAGGSAARLLVRTLALD